MMVALHCDEFGVGGHVVSRMMMLMVVVVVRVNYDNYGGYDCGLLFDFDYFASHLRVVNISDNED